MREAFVAALVWAVPATAIFALVLPPLGRVPWLSARHGRGVALFGALAFVSALAQIGTRVATG